jgi:hypothetical protein
MAQHIGMIGMGNAHRLSKWGKEKSNLFFFLLASLTLFSILSLMQHRLTRLNAGSALA